MYEMFLTLWYCGLGIVSFVILYPYLRELKDHALDLSSDLSAKWKAQKRTLRFDHRSLVHSVGANIESLRWENLSQIFLALDGGLAHYVLRTLDGRECHLPVSTVSEEFLNYLEKLPSFDFENLEKALTIESTEPFLCWKRNSDEGSGPASAVVV